jgi:hypothetical protein
MHNFGVEDCNDLTDNGLTCFANNPSSPYGVIMVPPPDGETENWELCGGTWMPLCAENRLGEKVGIPWHMKTTEAIVLLAKTPPDMKYFGFVNYVYEHTFPDEFEIDPAGVTLSRCWNDTSTDRRCDIFASLGDALNHGNIQTVSAARYRAAMKEVRRFKRRHNSYHSFEDKWNKWLTKPPPSVYNQPFAMVITASQSVFAEVEAVLKKVGVSVVNPLPLPGELLNLGFEDGKDTIINLLRTAFPTDDDAYQAWLDGPFHVHRVTRSQEFEDPSLYPKPDYCSADEPFPVRSSFCLTQRSENDEASRVGKSMDELKAAQSFIMNNIVSANWPTIVLKSSVTSFSAGAPDKGYDCLSTGQKCQGDSRDTYYPSSSEMVQNALKAGAITSKIRVAAGLPPLTEEEMANVSYSFTDESKKATLGDSREEYMIVVGVIHSATTAATYSSLSVYDLWKLQGIIAVSDDELAGSADAYLKGTEYEELSPYIYVVKFTRGHCARSQQPEFCRDVPSDGELAIPLETPLLFMERMYYDPETHVGLNADTSTAPQVVHTIPRTGS